MSIRDPWVDDPAFMFGPGFRDFGKFFIGFDGYFNHLNSLAQEVQKNNNNYPPYNIVITGETTTNIELALAGFNEEEIDVTLEKDKLTVKGSSKGVDTTVNFLHQGIAKRDFVRTFILNEEVEVTGADFKNGLLTISLERIVPDHHKPKKIAINKELSTIKAKEKELLTEKKEA